MKKTDSKNKDTKTDCTADMAIEALERVVNQQRQLINKQREVIAMLEKRKNEAYRKVGALGTELWYAFRGRCIDGREELSQDELTSFDDMNEAIFEFENPLVEQLRNDLSKALDRKYSFENIIYN